MKRFFFFILSLFCTALSAMAADPLFTYAEHSVLQQGKWVKISVEETGVHQLTYQDLQAMGFSHPENIRVFGYGGNMLPEHFNKDARLADDLPEIPIYLEKGSDGVFGAGDYILFYAQGATKVTYDSNNKVFTHTLNPYSTKGYYFLTTDAGEGKRITLQATETASNATNIHKTYQYFYHEQELINVHQSGREWYGEELSLTKNTFPVTFHIPHITTDDIYLSTCFIGKGEGLHRLLIDAGTESNTSIVYGSSSSYVAGSKGNFKGSVTHTGNSDLTVTLTYQPPFSNSTANLDFVGISAYQHLRMQGSSLAIFYPSNQQNNHVYQYRLHNTSPAVKIWEITNPIAVVEVPSSQQNDSLFFAANSAQNRFFMAVNTQGNFPKPQFVANVSNQDLHGWGQTDMVIISQQDYVAEAERLANHHRNYDGYTVKVITPDKIYNEFSSGTPDATAYRWLMKMLYDRASNESLRPKHLLFMGLAYYDNRGIQHKVPEMLSYQSTESLNSTTSYITDDYFTLLEDNEGRTIEGSTMDIGVGRFPVSNATEAKQCVSKTIRYATQSDMGTWRNSFTFMADDGDGNIHMSQAEALTETLMELNAAYVPTKIWLDAYPIEQNASGAHYPKAKEAVLRKINEGTLVFTYVGHGSNNTLTSEQTITRSDIAYLNNSNLGVWITATCDFSRYDDYEKSAGMEVVLNPNGGGIASFTTTRVVYSSNNSNLAQAVFQQLVPKFGANKPTLGEVIKKAKNNLKSDTNKLNFSLLGDPAITLHYPEQQVVTDKINGIPANEATLPALGLIHVEASVRDANNQIDTQLQGKAYVTLYDKAETLYTLAGKGGNPFAYKDYPNKLFSGTVDIVDGKIDFTFMMPKDINYAMGKGRLVYYLVDNDETLDGHGFCHDFNIGGTASDIDQETQGPVARIYLNTPQFIDGQKVNNQPVFYAHLYDEYGINTVGAGIGHDITLRLSHRPNEIINLNEYYTSSLNSYKNGVVRYPLSQLPEGEYTLEFKAWNLQNISTTQQLRFVVENGLKPTIESFQVYPNPIRNEATLSLQYDRPADIGKVQFFVYDLVGQLCWQSEEMLQTDDGIYTTSLQVNNGMGPYLKAGIYLASVRMTTSEGTSTQKTQKIIVLTQ